MNWVAPTLVTASAFMALAVMKEPEQQCGAVTEVIRYLPAPEVKLVMPTDWDWPVMARIDAPSYKEPECVAPATKDVEEEPRARHRYYHSRHRRRR